MYVSSDVMDYTFKKLNVNTSNILLNFYLQEQERK